MVQLKRRKSDVEEVSRGTDVGGMLQSPFSDSMITK
jgi:hypothetical protein